MSCCFATLCLMAMLISSIVGGLTSIGRSVGAASILGRFSEVGRFKGSLKCSAHRFRCSSMLVITLSTSLLKAHRFANLSPFSFLSPSPCRPMMSSYPVLSIPTLTFRSPIRMVKAFVRHLSTIGCSLS
ncbi:unnamed protein product [Schistosoma mattheei]|uniref:Secreted protein n=1 Tax=Schistosoma mattheei TaxID=31246 RepID=A0A3P8J4F4_9TREM|nr:unnamed protein product [Schistosoma mattheei]